MKDTYYKKKHLGRCPVCNNKDWIAPPVYAPQSIYARCKNCGLMKTDTNAIAKDLQLIYNEENYLYQMEFEYKNFYKYHLDKLKFILNKLPNKNLLTVGCGMGSDVKVAQDLGFSVFAIERSKYAIKVLKEKFKINIAEDIGLLPLSEKNKFGIIYMSHVLEHVEGPKDMIKKALPFLTKGGYLIISVPNPYSWAAKICKQTWNGWLVSEHFIHFSKKALIILLKEIGLEVTRIANQHRPGLYHGLCWLKLQREKDTLAYRLLMALHEAIRVRLLYYGEMALDIISKVFGASDEIAVYARKGK